MEALAGAGLMPLPNKSIDTSHFPIEPTMETNDMVEVPTEDLNSVVWRDKPVKLTSYPTLIELKSMIEEQGPEANVVIEPPPIEPLNNFIVKRTDIIQGLRDLRARMAKHALNCKISNTVGNSASIVGGILCFVFPPVGVPVLLAGSATSLGKFLVNDSFS